MIDSEILNVLGERGMAAESVLYAHIREWEAWWRGKNRAFHEYLENNAMGRPVRREMFRMNMAKKICEDWASLLLNDRTVVTVVRVTQGLLMQEGTPHTFLKRVKRPKKSKFY